MDPFKTSYTEPNIKSNIISSTSSKSNNKMGASSIKVDFDILSNMDKMKFIDTSLNKFYTKYLQQQAFIQHDQKIYEIIEKSDEPKIFNTLRNNYIREKNELKNMTNIHSDTRKVTDIISFVNLNNCKKKLYSIYKLSADDLGFMTSFMHHLGHRPKKIIKQKVNKKLEALSMGKLGNFLRKKEKDKKRKEEKKIKILNTMNNVDTLDNNNNYLKMYLKKLSNDSVSINNKSIEEYKIKENSVNKNNIYDKKQYISQDKNKSFLKKNTINFETQNIKLFRNSGINNMNMTNYNSKKRNTNKKFSLNYNNIYPKFKAHIENESFTDENKDEKNSEKTNNIYNKIQNSKFNVMAKKPLLNPINNLRNETINKVNIQTNNNKEELHIVNLEDSSMSNIDKNNKKDMTDSLTNSKQINNNEEKNKILNIYKASRNEFLQKVKQEGNILNKTSHRLSNLLYKLKKQNFETFQNERNQNQNLPQSKNKTEYNHENKGKKKFDKTHYQNFEKSRYRMPFINKVVYGENNIYDPFEELQTELLHEVKNQIRNQELEKKKNKKIHNSIVGIDILNKLIRRDSNDQMKKELDQINNDQEKIDNNKNKNKNKESSNIKIIKINKNKGNT